MCHMLCSNTAPQPEPARQHYPLLVEAVWRNRLRWYYAGGLSANAHFTLIPAVCGTYGGWNPEFALWWRGAVRETAAESSGSFANQAAMRWRTIGFLSITSKRQNFLVLAGCAFLLDTQVEGVLGRSPLSEEPEFWPAAPADATLDGGAKELFDFPPAAPVGGGEAPDPAATGLLRASGMRL